MRLMTRLPRQSARRIAWVFLVLSLTIRGTACKSDPDTDPFIEDCRHWCQFNMICDGGPENTAVCVDSCEDALELDAVDYGPDCETAFKTAMACVGDMTCDEYYLFQNVPVNQGPCPDVLARYYELCPGVFLAPDRPEQ